MDATFLEESVFILGVYFPETVMLFKSSLSCLSFAYALVWPAAQLAREHFIPKCQQVTSLRFSRDSRAQSTAKFVTALPYVRMHVCVCVCACRCKLSCPKPTF